MCALRHYLAEHPRAHAYLWLLGRSVSDEVLRAVGHRANARGGRRRAARRGPRCLGWRARARCSCSPSISSRACRSNEKDQQGLKAFAASLAEAFRRMPQRRGDQLRADLLQVGSRACCTARAHGPPGTGPGRAHTFAKRHRAPIGCGTSGRSGRTEGGSRIAGHALICFGLLNPEDIGNAITAGGIPARQLAATHCRDCFERWRRGAAAPLSRGESLDEIWEDRFERAASEPRGRGRARGRVPELIDARSPGRGKRGNGSGCAPGDRCARRRYWRVAVCHGAET